MKQIHCQMPYCGKKLRKYAYKIDGKHYCKICARAGRAITGEKATVTRIDGDETVRRTRA